MLKRNLTIGILTLTIIVPMVSFAQKKTKSKISMKPFIIAANTPPQQIRTTKQVLVATTTPMQMQTPSPSISTQMQPGIKPADKAFGFTFTLGRTASVYNQQDGSHSESLDSALSTNTKLGASGYAVSTLLEYSQDQRFSENSDWGRGIIGLGYKAISIAGDESAKRNLTLTPKVSLGLPLSREAAQRQSMLGYLSASGKFSHGENVMVKGFSLSLTLGAARNFHRYKEKTDGSINTQYSLSQSIALGYDFTDKLAIAISGGHYTLYNYQGSAREYFGHSQELGYKLNPAWSFTLGHQLGAPYVSVWKTDASTSNYTLVDENASYYYTTVTFTY